MEYKLLITDLDGTLTPNLGMPPREFMPSSYLVKSIQKAQKLIKISLCTGRDKETVLKVVNRLGLIAPQVIEGGAKIINSKGKELWAKYINEDSTLKMMKILEEANTPFSVIVNSTELFNELPKNNFDKISAILWYDLNQEQVKDLKKKLSSCKNIVISVNLDKFGNTVYITHKQGTKAYGVRKLMKILRVKKEKTIGVGDGNNDFQLLLNCGLKVAMGNAVEELKNIADYIAPSVDNDGVVDIIRKFVIQ